MPSQPRTHLSSLCICSSLIAVTFFYVTAVGAFAASAASADQSTYAGNMKKNKKGALSRSQDALFSISMEGLKHRPHADKTAADAEDTSQPAGEEADEDGQPCGAGDVGLLEVEHRRNLDGVQAGGPVNAGGRLVKFPVLGLGFAFLPAAGGDIVKYKPWWPTSCALPTGGGKAAT